MQRIEVSIHGVNALSVYQFFSCNAASAQKQQLKALVAGKGFHSINTTYYLQSQSDLHNFVSLVKPRSRNGESAEQLRNRFYEEHAYLLQQLPEMRGAGKWLLIDISIVLACQDMHCCPYTMSQCCQNFSTKVALYTTNMPTRQMLCHIIVVHSTTCLLRAGAAPTASPACNQQQCGGHAHNAQQGAARRCTGEFYVILRHIYRCWNACSLAWSYT
jgi:hypothetical protein